MIKEKKLTKWLADTSDFGEVEEDDIKWINNEYTPLNAKAGMKHIAFVISNRDFESMTVADGAMNTDIHGIITRYFYDIDEAISWLLKM